MFAYTNLTTLDIPGSVTTIEIGACYGCDNLTDVYLYWSDAVPNLTDADVFHRGDGTINPDLKIYIPVDMRAAYLEAVNDSENAWSHYKNYIFDAYGNPLVITTSGNREDYGNEITW